MECDPQLAEIIGIYITLNRIKQTSKNIENITIICDCKMQ